jgi:hypothetical protein
MSSSLAAVRPLKLFSPYLSSARFSVQPTQNNPVVLSSHQGASQMQFFWAVICYVHLPNCDFIYFYVFGKNKKKKNTAL